MIILYRARPFNINYRRKKQQNRQNPDDFKGFSSKNRGIAPNHAKFSHFDQYDRRDGQK
jgi:hypothetical protein